MDFSELFDQAVTRTLEQVKSRNFELQSEKDIQALIFHHAIVLAREAGLPPDIHAEPTKISKKPDLVFGKDEVFVETKLSKAGTGGYSGAIKKWRDDAEKLYAYKRHWPTARCVFLAVDEAEYHSSSRSKNFFDPTKQGLRGTWLQLTSTSKFLLAEI